MRVNTIRHRAWLAWRLPPGLRRWRTVLPDDAGIGAAAHQCAQAGLLAHPPGWAPTPDGKKPSCGGAAPREGEKAGSVRGHEGNDELVEAFELGVEELSAPSQLAQRDTGGIADGAARTGTQGRQLGHHGYHGGPGKAGSQVIWAGHDQGPGPVDRLGAFSCGAAPGDHQRTDRLDGAV